MIKIYIIRAFGIITFAIGVAMIAWFIYNQFNPQEEFESSFVSWFQLILPIGFVVIGWKWIRYDGDGIDETPVDFDCAELERSNSIAQERLSEFIEEVENNVDGAYIKYPLSTRAGSEEFVWAYVHNYKDGFFNVSIVNEAYDKNIETDSRRNVDRCEVIDWQIMLPSGDIKGAFSLIALFENRLNSGKELSPKMKKQRAQLLYAND